MPRLTDATKQARRDNIVNAAFDCFAQKGFTATSMQDIIDASGASAGAFYSHFESKTELVRTVASSVINAKYASLTQARTGTNRSITPAHLATLLLNDNFFIERAPLLLQVWSESLSNPELREMVAYFFEKIKSAIGGILTEWLVETYDLSGEALEAASDRVFDTMLAVMHGALIRLTLDPNVDPESLISNIAKSLETLRFD